MPPITRTDFPYPLRTIDGEVDVVVDTLIATNLDVTGQTNVQNLFVAGVTTIVGGIVDLADINCNTFTCNNAAQCLTTFTVGGLSTLSGGIQTAAINATNIVSTSNVSAVNVIASGQTSGATASISGLTTTGQLNVTGAATANSLIVTGAASANSLTLTTPLAPASGGTGQNNLAAVSVGFATVSGSTTMADNIIGGVAGAIPYQIGPSVTGFSAAGTSGALFTSQGAGTPTWNQSLSVSGNVVAGQFVNANSSSNATTASNGAIAAPLGGISCLKDIFNNGRIVCDNPSDSFSTTDGAIQTNGGVSVVKNIVGGGRVRSLNTTDALDSTDGAIQTNGGVSVVKNIISDAIIQSNLAQNATSAFSGAHRAPVGGISCGQDLWAGGRVRVNSTLDTVVTNSGAITCLGGVGIANNCIVGGTMQAAAISSNIFNGVNIVAQPFTPVLADLAGVALAVTVNDNDCKFTDYPGFTVIQFKYEADSTDPGAGLDQCMFTGCPSIFQDTCLIFGSDLLANIPGGTQGPMYMRIDAASTNWRPSRYLILAAGDTTPAQWQPMEIRGAFNTVRFNCVGISIRF